MSAPALAALASVLADGESKKSGPLGLAVILVLCAACYFLFKSMSKHLRKVREEFPVDGPAQGGELSAGPVRPRPATSAADAAAGPPAQAGEAPPTSDDQA